MAARENRKAAATLQTKMLSPVLHLSPERTTCSCRLLLQAHKTIRRRLFGRSWLAAAGLCGRHQVSCTPILQTPTNVDVFENSTVIPEHCMTMSPRPRLMCQAPEPPPLPPPTGLVGVQWKDWDLCMGQVEKLPRSSFPKLLSCSDLGKCPCRRHLL